MSARMQAGNTITLLKSGEAFFPALERAFESARREIHLQTYIYADDSIGRRIARSLVAAAARGVAVRLLVDGFGSKDFLDSPTRSALESSGVRLLVFRPWRGYMGFQRQRLRRMHRKLTVVDGEVAFIGGINIVDDFEQPRAAHRRLDYAVSIKGPILGPIHDAACSLWGRVSWSHFKRRWRPAQRIAPMTAIAGAVYAALLLRDNVKHRRDIENAYLDALDGAHSEVIIANAYFFPTRGFREALARAVQRGVKVVLILQGKVEFWFHHFASRALYQDLLRAGVQIYEYHRSYLHAKVAVIDGAWLTVGSSNIEPFSLLLAKEANVVTYDNASALALREDLLAEVQRGATRVEPERWEALPLLQRAMCRLALLLARAALAFSLGRVQREFD